MKIKELLEYGRNNLIAKEEPIRLSKMLLKGLLKVDDSYLIINQDITGRIPTDKQAKVAVKARARLIENGMPMQF